MPYTGMSIGYGWGANDAGGSNHYADRGLYNYQPRYTTATTASNNRLIGNYVHDVMQQMTDGGCIYTLSANPSAVISDNYCLRTNGWFGIYFDEGSRYYTASNNVFSSTGTWATANYWFAENMGNFTVTNNWSTNGSTNVTNGDRGNVVNGNVTVTNGNWPSGAQAVMASAGPAGGGSSQQNVQLVGAPVGPLRRRAELQHRQRHPGAALGLRRRRQPAVDLHRRASSCRCTATSAWTPTARAPTNGTQVIIWDCNGQTQPAVERQRQRHHHRRAVRAVPGREQRRDRQRHQAHPLVLQRRRPTSNGACAADPAISCLRRGGPPPRRRPSPGRAGHGRPGRASGGPGRTPGPGPSWGRSLERGVGHPHPADTTDTRESAA